MTEDDDYFVYLTDARRGPSACTVTAAGFTRIPPGSPYPPRRHPLDHHFSWVDGRVLNAFQVVYITHGFGSFESAGSKSPHEIVPGTVFLLLPGVWHRYAPDPGTGWTEHWVECRGPAFAQARRRGTVNPASPVLRPGIDPDLLDTFHLCHRWARRASPSRAQALSALGLHLLAVLQDLRDAAVPPTRAQALVRQAQAAIMERFHERMDMPDLARSLSVSYSHLRQSFKSLTGLSLKQYQLQVRLHRAQDLLANTDRSVKEIAEILGFDSPYHFSAQFKTLTGAAPNVWRRQFRPAHGD